MTKENTSQSPFPLGNCMLYDGVEAASSRYRMDRTALDELAALVEEKLSRGRGDPPKLYVPAINGGVQ